MRSVVASHRRTLAAGLLLFLSGSPAYAQQPAPNSPPVSPRGPRTGAVPATGVADAPPQTTAAPPQTATVPGAASSTNGAPYAQPGADPGVMPPERDLVQAHAGGLTGDEVARRAATTSWSAKASEESLRGAAARVDEAWASFLPRLSGVAKYTRLSDFTPPTLALTAPGLQQVYVPTGKPPPATVGCSPIGGGLCTVASSSFAFPLVLDNWLLQATITVPISDYFLRIDQTYTAATRSRDAAQWDVVTAKAGAASNGRATYYTWLRARGAVVVAELALDDQKTHLRDANNQFAVGNASRADVLRAETSVASAELAIEQAKNLADLSEKQVRVAIHADDDAPLLPAEDLEAPLPSVSGDLKALTAEALRERPEIKSADANAAAAREQSAAARAGRYPAVSAFADGILGNPNSRVFPSTNTWFPTWDVGAQLTWSPNDVIVAGGTIADTESQVAAIEANKNNVRDNIDIEVTQTWQNVKQADFSIDTSGRELASAMEAYRVARELFNNGRGTSTTLTDAETDLTRARLDLLNAKADARIARIRLDHAIGRDAH